MISGRTAGESSSNSQLRHSLVRLFRFEEAATRRVTPRALVRGPRALGRLPNDALGPRLLCCPIVTPAS